MQNILHRPLPVLAVNMGHEMEGRSYFRVDIRCSHLPRATQDESAQPLQSPLGAAGMDSGQRAPRCPVFMESSRVRASVPRISPRMIRSGR